MTVNSTKTNILKTITCCSALYCTMGLAGLATAAQYEVKIENHHFIPEQLEVTAGEKHRLIVINKDATPEEFESYELNREKIVAGNSKITVFLPPLDAGTYPFFGEFNEATAQGRLIVK